MIESLVVAGLAAIVSGALMLGALVVQTRLDAFATALTASGAMRRGAREIISRCQNVAVKHERRRAR